MEIFDYENNQIKLGNKYNTPIVKKNFFNKLVELYINKLNASNDLSYTYYSLVDNWNELISKIASKEDTLEIFECAEPIFNNNEYYFINNDKFIRIYIDTNDTVWLIVNDKPFKTKNNIYITRKELEELK